MEGDDRADREGPQSIDVRPIAGGLMPHVGEPPLVGFSSPVLAGQPRGLQPYRFLRADHAERGLTEAAELQLVSDYQRILDEVDAGTTSKIFLQNGPLGLPINAVLISASGRYRLTEMGPGDRLSLYELNAEGRR